jgi:hypothetical protein
MINKKMQNLCKIGYTYKEVLMRAKELWTTGCPYPFDVIFCIKVKNPHKYELLIHNKLNNYRTHKSREFFECNPVEIISYFKMENLITYNEDKLDYEGSYTTMMKQLMDDGEYDWLDFRIPDYPDYGLVTKDINDIFGDYI